jgi:hypothetical protein
MFFYFTEDGHLRYTEYMDFIRDETFIKIRKSYSSIRILGNTSLVPPEPTIVIVP